MPSAWKIVVNKRPKEIGGPPAREFYLVALPEKEAAVAVLRMREGYNDAELEVIKRPRPNPSTGWISNRAKFFAYRQLSDDRPAAGA